MKIDSEARLPDVVYATHPHRWVVLAGVWLAYFCFGMTVASLAPLVQPITQDLAISHSWFMPLQWHRDGKKIFEKTLASA